MERLPDNKCKGSFWFTPKGDEIDEADIGAEVDDPDLQHVYEMDELQRFYIWYEEGYTHITWSCRCDLAREMFELRDTITNSTGKRRRKAEKMLQTLRDESSWLRRKHHEKVHGKALLAAV